MSTGILVARIDAGPVATVAAAGPGGQMARRLLIAAVALPLLVGYVRLVGQQTGLYDTELGTALFAIALATTLVFVVWQTARELNAADRQRQAAEDTRRAAERGLLEAERRVREQVVWNLLSNAVKFTPPGGRIDVRVDRVSGDMRLRVTDTGIGIAPQFLPHLFERFQQADSPSTRSYGGLGLGLAIARNLVELHGGRFEASSDGRDAGATFSVMLPMTGTIGCATHSNGGARETAPHA